MAGAFYAFGRKPHPRQPRYLMVDSPLLKHFSFRATVVLRASTKLFIGPSDRWCIDMTAPNYSGLSFIVRFFFALWFPAAAVAQMTTTTTSSSHVLHIPGASKTLAAPILHAKGYVGLAHPTKVLATDAPWNERQDCEYGFRLYCTNEAFCDAGSYVSVSSHAKLATHIQILLTIV